MCCIADLNIDKSSFATRHELVADPAKQLLFLIMMHTNESHLDWFRLCGPEGGPI